VRPSSLGTTFLGYARGASSPGSLHRPLMPSRSEGTRQEDKRVLPGQGLPPQSVGSPQLTLWPRGEGALEGFVALAHQDFRLFVRPFCFAVAPYVRPIFRVRSPCPLTPNYPRQLDLLDLPIQPGFCKVPAACESFFSHCAGDLAPYFFTEVDSFLSLPSAGTWFKAAVSVRPFAQCIASSPLPREYFFRNEKVFRFNLLFFT